MPALSYSPIVTSETVDGLQATALVGVHSAIIGWDAPEASITPDHLGFAVRRSDFDRKTGQMIKSEFLLSEKRFKGLREDDREVRSNDAPFQRFRWNDYGLSEKKFYRYEVFPALGTKGHLKLGQSVSVDVMPSLPIADGTGVHFNRGVTSARAYLQKFGGKAPEDVANGEAYTWLSRGLKELLLEFISASKAGEELHVCIYEFHDGDVAAAIAACKAKVTVVYHAKSGDTATTKSKSNISKHKLQALCIPRKNTPHISHNKFAVRLVKGKPAAVWTGSANFSENAFNFQTNHALVIENADLASVYERYFEILRDDPKLDRKTQGKEFAQDRVLAVNSAFAPIGHIHKAFFSPVRNIDLLDAAIDLISTARSCVLVSAPFAMEAPLVEALKKNAKTTLEYGLANTTAKKKIEGLNNGNTRFFVPSVLKTYRGQAWDAKAFGSHKIHSKMIVADPWSDNPRVLVGSSNHSDKSCKQNDENNLLIEGDARIAAIMSVEFMRMFDHYKSRSFINEILASGGTTDDPLKENNDWARTAFSATARSHKYRDRIVFSGGE